MRGGEQRNDSDLRLQFEVAGRVVVGEFECESVYGSVYETNQGFTSHPLGAQQALRSR